MGKSMPLAILLVMVALLFVSWNNVTKYNTAIKQQYEQHLAAAKNYEEKQIYIDAVAEYEQVLALDPDDYDVAMKIQELYRLLNTNGLYTEQYLAACERAKNIDPTKEEPHFLLINYYWDSKSIDTAYKYLKDAQTYFPDHEEIKAKIKEIKGTYGKVNISFDEFKGFCYTEENFNGTAVVVKDGKYGLIDPNIATYMPCNYEAVSPLADDVFAVKKNADYYYSDTYANRKVATVETPEYLGPFNNGLALIKADGLYGYIDKSGTSYHIQFEDAGSFSNGIAPIKLEGKWYIIDKSFNYVSNLAFEDIIMDEYGFCSVYGVFFGKMDGKYHLYNVKGNNLSAAHCDGFEDAKLFASYQPAAVKIDGKWGYLRLEGNIFIEPKYEDADSFNYGYGPFKENGKWGCIGLNEERWIEPTFDYMTAFALNGKAYAENDGVQSFIELKYTD